MFLQFGCALALCLKVLSYELQLVDNDVCPDFFL